MRPLATSFRLKIRVPLLASALVVAACGGDTSGPPGPGPGPSHSIALSLSASSLSVLPGQAGSVNVTLTRGGGFAGPVDLMLEGAPAGVTGVFAPATLSGGTVSSTLTLTAAAGSAPATHSLVVRARGQGVTDQTGAVALTISAPPAPDFIIAVQPASLSVIQGRQAARAVTVTRLNGFVGPITLSVAGTPAGMSATVAGDNEVRLTLGRHVHVGDHVLTVSGTSGTLVRTAELRVRVFQSQPVSGGWAHSLAVAADGGLWTWGDNRRGQLGHGNTTSTNAPVRVGTGTDWVAVAGGSDHSIALRADGSIWVAGDNGFGQLGIAGGQQTTFQRVGTDNDWVAINVGDEHTMAIKADRSLWVWGRNRYGQVGNGSTANPTAPVRIATGEWVVASGGMDHTVAVRADGSLWVWGYNGYGQLGGSQADNVTTPQRVGTANDWLFASAGLASGSVVALRTNGTLWGWGRNISGELGLGSLSQQSTPMQLHAANDWVHVSGGQFTIALRAGGDLWSTGANAGGALGITGIGNRSEFVQAQGSGWQFVTTGQAHALGIGPAGALTTWGSNEFGMLGHGNNATQGYGPVPGLTVRWP